jgi:restriction system protein
MESELTARFIEKLWHVVLPFTLLFVVAGLALTVLVKTIEKRLIKFIRERRGIQTSGKIAAHKIPEHAGVIEAPACPQCGSKMVLREARRGAHAGQSFWGCSRYPGCRGTRAC